MNSLFFSLLLLASVLWPSSARAGQWIHLRTSQLELYTTATEGESRELIHVLGSTQSFMRTVSFLQAGALQKESHTPVHIVALRSPQEYQPFRLSPGAFGSFRHSSLCDYIVLQDIRPEHRHAALHEYMHLLFRQAGLKLPLWLNEGLADFYSSLETVGSQTRVGGVLPSRMRTFGTQPLLDLTTLFAVDFRSPFYNNTEQRAIFYAESWAMVHMLAMDPDYAPGLPQLIRSVSAGLSPVIAFAQVYGRSVHEMESALEAHLPVLSSPAVIVKAVPIDTQDDPVSCLPEQVQSELVLNEIAGLLPIAVTR